MNLLNPFIYYNYEPAAKWTPDNKFERVLQRPTEPWFQLTFEPEPFPCNGVIIYNSSSHFDEILVSLRGDHTGTTIGAASIAVTTANHNIPTRREMVPLCVWTSCSPLLSENVKNSSRVTKKKLVQLLIIVIDFFSKVRQTTHGTRENESLVLHCQSTPIKRNAAQVSSIRQRRFRGLRRQRLRSKSRWRTVNGGDDEALKRERILHSPFHYNCRTSIFDPC